VARVVLVEGTGKVVINNRTAQVGSPKFLKFELFEKNSFVSEVLCTVPKHGFQQFRYVNFI
jgi:ribosomal protein S9